VARRSPERRRGVPWWTPLLLLALLVAAVAGGIVAARGGSEAAVSRPAAPQPAATTTTAETTAATTRSTTTAVLAAKTERTASSRTLVAAGRALFPLPADLGSLVGRSARAQRVPVLDVVGPRIFWVGTSRRDRLLVHLQGRGTRWAIRPGQLLSFRSIVTTNRKGAARAWGLTVREGGRQLKRQGHHLEVFGPGIVFDRR
jgi:hypothetical protein